MTRAPPSGALVIVSVDRQVAQIGTFVRKCYKDIDEMPEVGLRPADRPTDARTACTRASQGNHVRMCVHVCVHVCKRMHLANRSRACYATFS